MLIELNDKIKKIAEKDDESDNEDSSVDRNTYKR